MNEHQTENQQIQLVKLQRHIIKNHLQPRILQNR
jgi:hypothetical protein